MKATTILTSLLALMTASVMYGQMVAADIPFAFVVKNKTFSAGKYTFVHQSGASTIQVQGPGKDDFASVLILTRLGAGIHTTPRDGHIVFDVDGGKCSLSEIWASGHDGFMLLATSKEHTHQMVDAPIAGE